ATAAIETASDHGPEYTSRLAPRRVPARGERRRPERVPAGPARRRAGLPRRRERGGGGDVRGAGPGHARPDTPRRPRTAGVRPADRDPQGGRGPRPRAPRPPPRR